MKIKIYLGICLVFWNKRRGGDRLKTIRKLTKSEVLTDLVNLNELFIRLQGRHRIQSWRDL